MKKGWQTKTLGDVCHVYQPETISQKQMIAGEFRVYGANGQIGWHNQFNHEEPELILGCRGSCGTVHVTEPRSWINGNAMVVHPTNGAMDISFLAYALKGGIELTDAITGAAQPQITRTSLMPLVISFPESLAEQQRIVGLLDEAFESLATAKANAEKNLKNAHDLCAVALEDYLKESSSCETVELGSLIELLTDYHANGSYEVLRDNVELKDSEDFAWMVRSTDFENEFQNEMRYITESAYRFLKKSQVFGGEIIMSKIGNAGKVYLMPEITRPCSLAMNLFLIRLNETKVSNAWVYRFLKSEHGEKQILSKLKGAATQTITKESVRSIQIPLLPRNIQDLFVSKIGEIEAETQRLESIYKQKITALDELKKALLHKAFAGEL